MIKSMTGFGIGESSDGRYNFSVEIKTVNHRYNDIMIRMPKHLSYLEDKIKTTIKDRINRGRVEVYIKLGYIDEAGMDIKVDFQLARAYKDRLNELIGELQIKDDIKLSHILAVPEIIQTESKKVDDDSIWNCLKIALEVALDNVMTMRKNEGIELKRDMENQLVTVQHLIGKIENRAPLVVIEYKEKLKERIEELLKEDCNIDEDRLNYEVVFFADKSDITEEITRFKSHIKQFSNSLMNEEAVGRKLDFIIQEMNREINTIGSKANDLYICNYVVDIKSELEKIREQVQNIE
ncbi:MAG: YicC family protein [Tissierellia bacterium]|nr:YicC family protein [Tissierellia bacterium]